MIIISVDVDGVVVRYVTYLDGPAKFDLINDFKQEYGAQNVRIHQPRQPKCNGSRGYRIARAFNSNSSTRQQGR